MLQFRYDYRFKKLSMQIKMNITSLMDQIKLNPYIDDHVVPDQGSLFPFRFELHPVGRFL